jgi:hypothetical protein
MSQSPRWCTTLRTSLLPRLRPLYLSATESILNFATLYLLQNLIARIRAIPQYPSTATQAVLCSLMRLTSRNSPQINVIRYLVLVMAVFYTKIVDGAFYMAAYYAGKVVYGYGVAVQGGRGG